MPVAPWKSYPFCRGFGIVVRSQTLQVPVWEATVLCISWSQLGVNIHLHWQNGKMTMGKRESKPDEDTFQLPWAWQIGLWHFPQLDTVQQPVPARRGSSGCRLEGATRNATRHPTNVFFLGKVLQGFRRLWWKMHYTILRVCEFMKVPYVKWMSKRLPFDWCNFLGQLYEDKVNEKSAGLAPLGRGPAIRHAARCDLL